ncbi:chaperone protein dnaJ 11, chloroplastic-like [Neltuma alba]|uniref:chaperone protein dnaJ 11, chloroplastic-like n=1 Tax=Neltuma alba TaxID=207710 RepID=UPI0010A53955|nr:chaperone protein dnaJ 11, chloroplastic-like [Prosopis alba]XP_028771511.1 chaperone protein dnaJ 11, chloroplastic-like [Prosopis alba]XP_028788087.1 chaperone protein dnaJ 11, chloroplastic-like [Prosopis alba]
MAGTLNFSLPAVSPVRSSSSNGAATSSVRFLPHQCRASMRSFATEAGSAAVASRRPASLYEVLRVSQNASPREIKSAYRSLAKIYHPDSVLHRSEYDDDQDFIEIHNAYATLSDPSARAIYDLSLMAVHGRRRPVSSSAVQNASSGFYTTRRWETDQCW